MAEPISFEVLIEQPHADTNEYAYDESARAVRLERVIRVNAPAFADRGIVVNSVTPRGEPLCAWLVCDAPNSPHARVEARAVGALEYQRGELIEQVIVAVPAVDPRYARVRSFNALPGPHRAALQRMLGESARWLDANTAEELVHLARQRARLAKVEEHARVGKRPAWEMGSDFNYIEHISRETTLHTQAEAALFTVPYRFQQHLRLCLTPAERILFWMHRPRMTINRIARLGGRRTREGLLVLTDQQCLWMVDPVTATVSVEGGYGYIARPIAVELLAEVNVFERSDHVLLQIASMNGRGERATIQIEFPLSERDELHQVTRLLCAFVSPSDDRCLRRIACPRVVNIQLDDPMEDDHAKTAALVTELQKALAPQLNGATIYAQAFLPPWADGGTQMLTVTNQKIYLTTDHAHMQGKHAAYDIHSMIAPEICFSVLGSWLRVHFPAGKMLEVRFPLTAFKGFNTCWLMLRQLSINVRW